MAIKLNDEQKAARAAEFSRQLEVRVKLIEQLVELRKEQGLSGSEMGRRLQIAQTSVYKFENIANSPRLSTLQRYANALGYEVRITIEKLPGSEA